MSDTGAAPVLPPPTTAVLPGEPPVLAPPVVVPRAPARPIFGWIAFGLIVAAALVVAGAVIAGYLQTQDAFIQGPPWWIVTSSIAVLPVAGLAFVALVLGIVGVARREKPGWPAIAALILALPGFGYVAISVFVLATVTVSCAGPPGACG